MAYITLQRLKDRLGTALYARLTDRVAGEAADDGVGQQIVAEAEAEANSRLALRYATPVELSAHPEVADVLTGRVLDLAEALAWHSSPFMGDVPDRVRLLRTDAIAWFDAAARGLVHLPAAALLRSPTAFDDAARTRSSARVFAADELDGL